MYRSRKKKKRSEKRIALALLTVAVCAAILAFIIPHFVDSGNVYEDGEEFAEFADTVLSQDELCKPGDDMQVDYDYDKPLSTAIRYDPCPGEGISAFRDRKIKNIISGCEFETVREERKRLQESDEDDLYRPLAHALVIDSSVRESGNGAISLVIYYRIYGQDDRDMVLRSSKVETCLFSEATGERIEPIQALNVNYRNKASRFARGYIESKYENDELKDGWASYISEDDANFNSFLMTGSAIIFYLDEDTVLEKSKGIVKLSIPYIYMGSAVRQKVLDRHIDPDRPMVALTYDDGPGGESEERILDCLEKHGCVATFFYLGSRISANVDNAAKAVEMGCEIGNHSWDHPQLPALSKGKIASQIDRTNEAIEAACGTEPVFIRPPYGAYSKKAASVVKARGMSAVLWTVDTLDWKTRNTKKIIKAVKKVKKLDGKIILMHSIYDESAKATEKIVPWLQKLGYQTVTISELIRYKTGESPKAGAVYRTFK